MGAPAFGIQLLQRDDEARPVIAADLSTIGIIGPCPGADLTIFPLNTPVLVNSNDSVKTAALGTGGYVPDALRAINDQLGETQFAARCVVINVATGQNADPAIALQRTITNIVGSSLDKTGIHAFMKSASVLGVTPRIIVAPGYTGQMANGIGVVTHVIPGAGYLNGTNYPITFSSSGDPEAVQATGHAFGQPSGALGPIILDTPGAWYTAPPTITAPSPARHVTVAAIGASAGTGYAVGDSVTLGNSVVLTVATITGGGATGPIATVLIDEPGSIAFGVTPPTNPVAQVSTTGGGTAANFTLTWSAAGTIATYTTTITAGANPIIASLPGVLNPILAHAIVESSGQSQLNDNDWRESFQSGRIIPLSGTVRVLDPDLATVVFRPLAPRMAGILVRRDHETGAPFHSAANQPVQGIVGPGRDIAFELTDDANEGQELLKNNIGVVVRGQIGDDFAIASGGFVLISYDNAGEDELWRFYNVQRGRDFIVLSLLHTLRYYLGRYNIVKHTVTSILHTIDNMLATLKADEHILGYKVRFKAEGNTPEELRKGHLTVSFEAEEPAPLRLITVEHSRYRAAVDAMVADLASQLNLATA